MFIWVTFIFLIHVLTTSSEVILEEVQFLSSQLPSGQIILHGTIFRPSSSSNNSPAAVLVTGSGPANRYEEAGGLRPLYDIGYQLAVNGIIALVYDKRECYDQQGELCTYKSCDNITADCLKDPNLINHSEFIADAQTAFEYLLSYKYVNQKQVGLIGHSQGCTTIIHAGAIISQVKFAVCLMGVGVTIGQISSGQALISLENIETLYKEYDIDNMPNGPQKDAYLKLYNDKKFTAQCTLNTIDQQMNLLDSLDNISFICIGGFNSPNITELNITSGNYCPGECGTGICSEEHNTNECLNVCLAGRRHNVCAPTAYVKNLNDQMLPDRQLKSLTALSKSNVHFLVINSPNDTNAVEPSYLPLHKYVNEAYHNNKELSKIVLLSNLTHMMTPTDNSNTTALQVMPIVHNTISTFIHNSHSSIAAVAATGTTITVLSITAINIVLVQLTSATYEI
jgi:dienelactone hydrolase